MEESLRQQFQVCKRKWEVSSTDFPNYLSVVSDKQKKNHESKLDHILTQLKKQVKMFPQKETEQLVWKQKAESMVIKALQDEDVFGIGELGKDWIERMTLSIKTFIKKVRRFDPSLSVDGFGQAINNYMVYLILSELYETQHRENNGAIGYSLLYPFTDNILDDNQKSKKEKQIFNEWLYQRLLGKEKEEQGELERKISQCVQWIENTYDRKEFLELHQSIMMIYQAQLESMRQQKDLGIEKNRILELSIYKGASSVLADAYLVKGTLAKEERAFPIEFGLFLQFADDLKDMKEDQEKGHQTMFTYCAKKGEAHLAANQMFHYIQLIFQPVEKSVCSEEKKKLVHFIKRQCILLTINSIFRSKEYFSVEYLNKMEEYSFVTGGFMDHLKDEMKAIWIEAQKEGISAPSVLDLIGD